MDERLQSCVKVFVCVLSVFTLLVHHINGQEDSLGRMTFASQHEFLQVYHDEAKNKLFVGSINKIFMFDSQNVSFPLAELNWLPDRVIRQTCMNYNSDHRLCQNNIRILQSVNETHLYACGTMAYYPTCIYIKKENLTLLESTRQSSRLNIPNDPYQSVVSIMTENTLYTATRDLHGNDGVICKTLKGAELRTQHADKFILNDPQYVGIHHMRGSTPEDNKIIVLLREKAEEFQPYRYGLCKNPTQRNVASRVASVCVNDLGGTPWILNRNFATFSKMSIVCDSESNSDGTSFQYTHLEATFVVDNELGDQQTLYGLFTMPNDAVAGTAVCAFRLNDVQRAMETDKYWVRPERDGVSNSYNQRNGPSPGSCVKNTQRLSQARLMFGQRHPIKFGNIYPSGRNPIFQESGVRYKRIAAEYRRTWENTQERSVTILYLITERGFLKRLVLSHEESQEAVSLPDIDVLKERTDEVVKDLIIGKTYIYVISNRTIIQLPKAQCSLYQNCHKCSEARDPYCKWTWNGCKPITDISFQRRSEFITPTCNFQSDMPQDPQEALMAELLANHTSLREKNNKLEKDLAGLQSLQQTYIEAQRICLKQNEILYSNLTACSSTKTELTEQLEGRPTTEQLQVEAQKGTEARRNATRCYQRLEVSNKSNGGFNHLTNKIEMLHQAREKISRQASEQAERANIALATCRWKIQRCYSKSIDLQSDIKRLNGQNLNITDVMNGLSIQIGKEKERIKDLTALNPRSVYTAQGQQNCNDNGWFLSNFTGKLFHLARQRGNYSEAVKTCQRLGGRLAIIKRQDESRYIRNVIRSFQPNRHFWIGLIKHRNQTLMWEDGTRLYGSSRKFPATQLSRISRRSKYCVEVNSSRRWYLMGCGRFRRPLCEKDYFNVAGSRPPRTMMQFVSMLPDEI